MNNQIISEDMLYANILDESKNILDILNKKKEKKNEIKAIKKVYGNAFSLLLLQGYKCEAAALDEGNGYIMTINNKDYMCDEETLKGILFKDFDEVISKSLE